MDEIEELNPTTEESMEDFEESLKAKILNKSFNYYAEFVYRAMLRIKRNSRAIRPIEIKAEMDCNVNTYFRILSYFKERKLFVQGKKLGTYVIQEKFVRFVHKYFFVIKAIHEKTFNMSRMNELLAKTQSVQVDEGEKAEEITVEEKQEEVKKDGEI